MIRFAGFFCGPDVGSASRSLRAADRSRRAKLVVHRQSDSDIRPPNSPTSRVISQGTNVRRAIFLHRPEVTIISRVRTCCAVITPSVTQRVALLFPITVLSRLESNFILHRVYWVAECSESIV